MTLPTLHITFNLSAEAELRRALAQAGRDDEIATMWDNLSFGPINPPEAGLRAQWIETQLGYAGFDECGTATETFWSTVFSEKRRRIVWTSRRSAQEMAGFLEFVWRLGDRPCDFIDVSDATIKRRGKDGETVSEYHPVGSAEISATDFAENKLWDLAKGFTAELRIAHRRKWEMLKAENAALRILDSDSELTSAPITYFDQRLLSFAQAHWLKSARIVGEVLFSDDNVAQVGDFFLASRLRALVEARQLEGQGDLSKIRLSEVRLPQTKRQET